MSKSEKAVEVDGVPTVTVTLSPSEQKVEQEKADAAKWRKNLAVALIHILAEEMPMKHFIGEVRQAVRERPQVRRVIADFLMNPKHSDANRDYAVKLARTMLTEFDYRPIWMTELWWERLRKAYRQVKATGGQ